MTDYLGAYGSPTQRVRVLCRKCGQMVFDLHDTTKDDGTLLLGYLILTGRGDTALFWEQEQWCRDFKRDRMEGQHCPRDGALEGVTWRVLFDALGQARRTGRLVTLRTGKSR